MNINEKLKKLSAHLEGGLVGRRDHARMLLLAAVAGENAMLFGPPGTAKSLLARRLKDCFADDIKYFECLLTKFSMPEEVFGPVSLKGLEQDIYQRVYARYMPSAGVAFIDETFKANSAILNSMLTILNEREFDTGNERIKVPLRCVVGASNEKPEESELAALYDRFIIRMKVDRLQDEDQLTQFLTNTEDYVVPASEYRLTKSELEEITKSSLSLRVEDSVVKLLIDLREWCHGNKIIISDRRLLKIKRLVQVAAATSGRQSASLADTWVIRHCAWDDFTSKQPEKLAEWLDSQIDKQQHNLSGLRDLVAAEGEAFKEKALVHEKNDDGKFLYLSKEGKETIKTESEGYQYSPDDDNDGMLYSADQIKTKLRIEYNPDNYGRIYINNSQIALEEHFKANYKLRKVKHKPKLKYAVYTLEQGERFKASSSVTLDKLISKGAEISEQIDSLAVSLDSSPWTPKEYQESHVAGLKANLQELEKFQVALQEVITGYDKMLFTSDVEKLTNPEA